MRPRLFSSWTTCVAIGSVLGVTTPAVAQLAPSGYTSTLNTPSADVLPTGTLAMGLANNNPEFPRKFPGYGYSGSTVLGFGALPGLELTSRLAYDGDLNCNAYDSTYDCRSWTRDVSINGKYQLPLTLPLNTRLAAGFTDFGGAATNFKQHYGVASSRWNYLEFSLGYAKPSSSTALLNGTFWGGTVHVTERIKVSVEDDHRQRRYGASFTHPLMDGLDLQATLSRRFQGDTALQANQVTVGFQWALDHAARQRGSSQPGQRVSFEQPRQRLEDARQYAASVQATTTTPSPAPAPLPASATTASATPYASVPGLARLAPETTTAPVPTTVTPSQPPAPTLSQALAKRGFRNIHIGRTPDNTQWLVAEPVGWRQSRLEALGAALATWLSVPGAEDDRLWLTLTYLQQPVFSVETTRACARQFREGEDQCGHRPALRFLAADQRPEAVEWQERGAHSDWLHPRLEVGLALRYNVGTEYGLTDHSAALSGGWEVPLAKGLLWQGNYTSDSINSDDYAKPTGYWYNSRIRQQRQTQLVSYQHQVLPRTWVQVSEGYITPTDRGEQANVHWLSPMGRWRVSGMAAQYKTVDAVGPSQLHQPRLLSARYSVLPGLWSVDVTQGRFYYGDQGTRVMSHHWFGDHRLTFYYRDTQSPDATAMPRTKFAGFEISFPLGPRESGFIGPLNVRGQDQFSLGLETKVGANDNYITSGYGAVPGLRHGLADITDQDRTGIEDLWANRYRLRAVLRDLAVPVPGGDKMP